MIHPGECILILSADKPSYTIQIFWKGDPGVENFVIRFATEEIMNKWRDQITMQKEILSESARSSGQHGTSKTEFLSMKNQKLLENPYLQHDDDDAEEDDSQGSTLVDGQSNLAKSRNPSSNSLRGAATLAGGSMLPVDRSTHRVPPSRLPQQDLANNTYAPPLTLHTNIPVESPGEFAGNSYFSPTVESPISGRSSSQAGNYFLPHRQATPSHGRQNDDHKHKTAPAMTRVPSRDEPGIYGMNGRTPQRPSLPVMAGQPNSQQMAAIAQSRLRSVSTPDIHNSSSSGPRRYANGQLQPSIDNTPVPPLPSYMRAPVNRSQANSPIIPQIPIRSATQSPQLQRDNLLQQRRQQYQTNQQNAQTQAPTGKPLQMMRSPAPAHCLTSSDIPYPSQLKVKIWFEPAPSHVTIVVPIIIKHRSLIDRIDSKMVKISSASISNGTARLRYKDQDDDSMNIDCDEDVVIAIEDWAMGHIEQLHQGIVGDFELFWHVN